jgi:ApaG protein
MNHPKPTPRFFYRLTNGIRITVRPEYLADRSDPARHRFVFAYHVRIENVESRSARLISRKWLIHDAIGEDVEVEGEGVVGEQPVIGPGEVHEYQSFIVLKASSGYMEGTYRFVRADGSGFEAEIPRFALAVAELDAG